MRKIISTMLVLVMVLSVFTSFSAGAAHWAQEAIDFVTENGYWIAPQAIEPDRPATRAETASLFARILISKIPENNRVYKDVTDDNIYGGDITAVSLMELMVGYDNKFRPDDLVTREELACILDRASKMVSDEFADSEYNMAYYKDRDQVSDWAHQSVMNASQYLLMKGKGHKLFDPKGQTTVAEVATVVKSLADLSDMYKEASKTRYSVRDINNSDNIKEDFDVLQTAGLELSCGYGGWGMFARFSGGETNIYLQRQHYDSQPLDAMAHLPVIVRITDPEGNVVCRVDMDYAEGIMEKIVTIPDAQEGIYRIMFTGGSISDLVSIGLQQPVSWGMLLQDSMYFTETQTQNQWYLYTPKKFAKLSFGIGGEGAIAAIWTADGNSRISATAAATATANTGRARQFVTSLEPDSIYMLELPQKFEGVFGMVGVSQLLCPTPEMAADLKGGYEYYSDAYGDWQFEGPLQIKARKRMVEIYEEMNGDFAVDLSGIVPENSPTEGLDNPKAEAMLFGAYFGSIIGVNQTMDRQVLDPANPWFGCQATMAQIKGEEPWPELDWQHRFYGGGGMRVGLRQMVGAFTINAETNYWYANPIYQKRIELQQLAWIVQMNSGGGYTYLDPRDTDGCNLYFRTYENFQFGEQGWTHNYYYCKDFLSPKTKAITDNGFRQMAETVMYQRGQGVNNQMLMGIQGILYSYLWTRDEFFHEAFARLIDGTIYPSTKPTSLGQSSPQGYWQEGAGSDGGSYGRMNEGMWDDIVLHYMTLPEEQKRPEVVEDLISGTERFLLFDSMWYCPPINGFQLRNSNAWTTRNAQMYGAGSAIPGNAYIQNIFPRAMANHDAQVAGVEDPDTFNPPGGSTAGTVASIIMSDDWAYAHLNRYWEKYLGMYADDRPDSYMAGSSWSMYKALHEEMWFEYDEIPALPYALEGNYNIYDIEGGSIAGKHDGLYIINYYNHDLGDMMNGYSWITPGPTQIWDEYFGTIIVSNKPARYAEFNLSKGKRIKNDYITRFSDEELVHTTIVGKNANGTVFAEGKGESVFNWIEEGKSWSVTHTDPFSERNTTWKYFMNDEGWTFEAGFDKGVDPSDKLWVQIPVVNSGVDVEGAQLIYDPEACTLTWSHDGHTTTLSWEKGTESKLDSNLGEASEYRFLKIKLTKEKPVAKFSITREMGDYKLVRGIRDGKPDEI